MNAEFVKKDPLLDLVIPDFLLRSKWTKKELAKVVAPLPTVSQDRSLSSPKEKPKKKIEDLPTEKKKEPVNIQARIREKASEIIGEIEGRIDDGITEEWSLFDYLNKNQISKEVTKYIGIKYQPKLDELIAVLEGNDPQLNEAYQSFNKADIESLALVYARMVEDTDKYIENQTKLRKINTAVKRMNKPKSLQKIVKDVKYALKFDDLKLVSIPPEKVVGAQELWTYNIPQKLLTVYRALDKGGLTFRSSSVININEATSGAKYIGRNTEERLQEVLKGGKLVLRGIMNDIKGDLKKPQRITKQTILLRVL